MSDIVKSEIQRGASMMQVTYACVMSECKPATFKHGLSLDYLPRLRIMLEGGCVFRQDRSLKPHASFVSGVGMHGGLVYT